MLIAAQTKTQDYWYDIADRIAGKIAASAGRHDCEGQFVAENYACSVKPG